MTATNAGIEESRSQELLETLHLLSSQGGDILSSILDGVGTLRSMKAMDYGTNSTDTVEKEGSTAGAINAINMVISLHTALTDLIELNNELDRLISCAIAYYWFYKEINGISRTPRNRLIVEGADKYVLLRSQSPKLPYLFNQDTFEDNCGLGLGSCIPAGEGADNNIIRYFKGLAGLKEDILKAFFSADEVIPLHHSLEAAKTAVRLKDSLKAEFARSESLFNHIFSNTEDGLITETVRVFIEVKKSDRDASAIMDFITFLSGELRDQVTYFEEKYECSLGLSLGKLNKLLESLGPKEADESLSVLSSNESIPVELEDSLIRVLEYSKLSSDKADFLASQIRAFSRLESKDKYELVPPESKRMTNSIFLELYEAVTARAVAEKTEDKAIDMFLLFGFLDSSLLSKNQTIELYKLLGIYGPDGSIFSSKRWFEMLFTNERAPSITEMGLDYERALKEKYGKAAAVNKAPASAEAGRERINHEIMNMFQAGNKLCYGQLSTYFPVLHGDMLPGDISKAAVTINKVKDSLQNVLKEDFSAFHREVFYTGKTPIFGKELVMKQVLPDIVLLPTSGTKAIMWQETGGRSKLTPGRFIMPILTTEDLNSLMIKLTGNFRWELCRSMMGARWNDVSYSSLTSDYADYIQDYKKNKNLSQDSKEKVKIQIQRHHGNLRNIFSSDYEAWIKSESKGIRKLNREARAILYRYCPFKRAMREELTKQPAFTDIAVQFENERRKLARELESRYTGYERHGYTLEPELVENLRFYKEF